MVEATPAIEQANIETPDTRIASPVTEVPSPSVSQATGIAQPEVSVENPSNPVTVEQKAPAKRGRPAKTLEGFEAGFLDQYHKKLASGDKSFTRDEANAIFGEANPDRQFKSRAAWVKALEEFKKQNELPDLGVVDFPPPTAVVDDQEGLNGILTSLSNLKSAADFDGPLGKTQTKFFVAVKQGDGKVVMTPIRFDKKRKKIVATFASRKVKTIDEFKDNTVAVLEFALQGMSTDRRVFDNVDKFTRALKFTGTASKSIDLSVMSGNVEVLNAISDVSGVNTSEARVKELVSKELTPLEALIGKEESGQPEPAREEQVKEVTRRSFSGDWSGSNLPQEVKEEITKLLDGTGVSFEVFIQTTGEQVRTAIDQLRKLTAGSLVSEVKEMTALLKSVRDRAKVYWSSKLPGLNVNDISMPLDGLVAIASDIREEFIKKGKVTWTPEFGLVSRIKNAPATPLFYDEAGAEHFRENVLEKLSKVKESMGGVLNNPDLLKIPVNLGVGNSRFLYDLKALLKEKGVTVTSVEEVKKYYRNVVALLYTGKETFDSIPQHSNKVVRAIGSFLSEFVKKDLSGRINQGALFKRGETQDINPLRLADIEMGYYEALLAWTLNGSEEMMVRAYKLAREYANLVGANVSMANFAKFDEHNNVVSLSDRFLKTPELTLPSIEEIAEARNNEIMERAWLAVSEKQGLPGSTYRAFVTGYEEFMRNWVLTGENEYIGETDNAYQWGQWAASEVIFGTRENAYFFSSEKPSIRDLPDFLSKGRSERVSRHREYFGEVLSLLDPKLEGWSKFIEDERFYFTHYSLDGYAAYWQEFLKNTGWVNAVQADISRKQTMNFSQAFMGLLNAKSLPDGVDLTKGNLAKKVHLLGALINMKGKDGVKLGDKISFSVTELSYFDTKEQKMVHPLGMYYSKTRTGQDTAIIAIDPLMLTTTSNMIDVLTHEFIHAAVEPVLEVIEIYENQNKPLPAEYQPIKKVYDQLNALRFEVISKSNMPDTYGLTDVSEFVAEALSNRDFQIMLNMIKDPTGGHKSILNALFSKIAELLKTFFGLPASPGSVFYSALHHAMTLVEMTSDNNFEPIFQPNSTTIDPSIRPKMKTGRDQDSVKQGIDELLSTHNVMVGTFKRIEETTKIPYANLVAILGYDPQKRKEKLIEKLGWDPAGPQVTGVETRLNTKGPSDAVKMKTLQRTESLRSKLVAKVNEYALGIPRAVANLNRKKELFESLNKDWQNFDRQAQFSKIMLGNFLKRQDWTTEALILGKELQEIQANIETPLEHKDLMKALDRMIGQPRETVSLLQSLACLDLDWSKVRSRRIFEAIKNYDSNENINNLAEEDKVAVKNYFKQHILKSPANVAVAVEFAKAYGVQMALLQRRFVKDVKTLKKITNALDSLNKATPETLDALWEQMKLKTAEDNLAKRLQRYALKAKRELKTASETLEETKAVIRDAGVIVKSLTEEIRELDRGFGGHFNFEAVPGATYMVAKDEANPNTDWEEKTLGYSEMESTEVLAAVMQNKRWLANMRSNPGVDPRAYETLLKMTKALESVSLRAEHDAATRSIATRLLASITDQLRETNTNEGRAAAEMIVKQHRLFTLYAPEFQAKSRKYSKLVERISETLGYDKIIDAQNQILDPLLHYLNTNVKTDPLGFVKQQMILLERKDVNAAKIAAVLNPWLDLHKELAERLNEIRDSGMMGIEQDGFKAYNPFTGKFEPYLRRKGIQTGDITSPRVVDTEICSLIANLFTGKNPAILWSDLKVSKTTPFSGIDNDLTEEGMALEIEHIDALFSKAYMENDNMSFFMRIFLGWDSALDGVLSDVFVPEEFKGHRRLFALKTWENSNGSLAAFLQNIGVPEEDLVESMRALVSNMGKVIGFSKTISDKSKEKRDNVEATQARHFLVDSRSAIDMPSDLFNYLKFDPLSINSHLFRLSANIAFGRNGERLDSMFTALVNEYRVRGSKATGKGDSEEETRWRGEALRVLGMQQDLRMFMNKSDFGAHIDSKLGSEFVRLFSALVINQPKTGLTNIITPATGFFGEFKGINGTSIKATVGSLKDMSKSLLYSLLEFGGISMDISREENIIGDILWTRHQDALNRQEYYSNVGRDGQYVDTKYGRWIVRLQNVQRFLSRNLKFFGDRAEANWQGFTPVGIFNWISRSANWGVAVNTMKTYSVFLNRLMNYAEETGKLSDPGWVIEKDPKAIKRAKSSFGFGTEASALHMLYTIPEFVGVPVETLVRKMYERKKAGQHLLSKEEIIGLATIGETNVSLNSSVMSRPMGMIKSPTRTMAFTLLGWPVRQMEFLRRMFTNPETGDVNLDKHLLRGVMSFALATLPISLVYSMLMEGYDELFRDRSPNLRKVKMDNAPIENIKAVVERVSRMGTLGLGGDVINSVVNFNDSFAGQNPFSLDERILVMGWLQNWVYLARNVISQEGVSYQTFWQPFISNMGGNGLLQFTQNLNSMLGELTGDLPVIGEPLFDNERVMTQKVNVNNIIRSGARDLRLEIRAGGGYSSPTPVSLRTREMQLAAYSGDIPRFMSLYEEALALAFERGKEREKRGGPRYTEQDAREAVLASWRSRHPLDLLKSVSSKQVADLFDSFNDRARSRVEQAVNAHDSFSLLIGVKPRKFNRPAAEMGSSGTINLLNGFETLF